ncbi:tripartite tricarboxylate transporter TctB family protein [Paenibacillus sp. P96]|uniref:Tripartite tricarboxylate transporter TctB family protein n=1 Tax=Paenibacillus zeirhizosphaerae TaxID=2987519 RepID=A0ABT9FVH1_9BACL|nr:tripartite tricarboxylate transporter TctB family protein [Paenibacillus sp. P96]MDP4098731.1 tripartite tricarboxylate transporter TctB family protein [Paenibacillus sp. P96]
MISKKADRTAGALTVVIGGVALMEAVKLFQYRAGLWNGDHIFPFMIGIGLVLSGIALTVRGGAAHASIKLFPKGRKAVVLAAVPALLIVYLLLMTIAGYTASTLVCSLLLFRMIGSMRWVWAVLAAVLLTGAMYLIFIVWLMTPLPAANWMGVSL